MQAGIHPLLYLLFAIILEVVEKGRLLLRGMKAQKSCIYLLRKYSPANIRKKSKSHKNVFFPLKSVLKENC